MNRKVVQGSLSFISLLVACMLFCCLLADSTGWLMKKREEIKTMNNPIRIRRLLG